LTNDLDYVIIFTNNKSTTLSLLNFCSYGMAISKNMSSAIFLMSSSTKGGFSSPKKHWQLNILPNAILTPRALDRRL